MFNDHALPLITIELWFYIPHTEEYTKVTQIKFLFELTQPTAKFLKHPIAEFTTSIILLLYRVYRPRVLIGLP